MRRAIYQTNCPIELDLRAQIEHLLDGMGANTRAAVVTVIATPDPAAPSALLLTAVGAGCRLPDAAWLLAALRPADLDDHGRRAQFAATLQVAARRASLRQQAAAVASPSRPSAQLAEPEVVDTSTGARSPGCSRTSRVSRKHRPSAARRASTAMPLYDGRTGLPW